MENLLRHEMGLLAQDLRKYLQENYSSEERIYYTPENLSFLRTSPTVSAAPQKKTAPIHSVSPTQTAPPPAPANNIQRRQTLPSRKPLPFNQAESQTATPPITEKREIRLANPKEQQAATANNHTEMLQNIRAHIPDFQALPPPQPDAAPLIAILKQGETGVELRFLHHIAEAIQSCFQIPCKVIARTNAAFDPAVTKLMIAAEHRLPSQLPNIPLLALPDLSLHMQNPSLKANLWSTICQNIKKHVHR